MSFNCNFSIKESDILGIAVIRVEGDEEKKGSCFSSSENSRSSIKICKKMESNNLA